MTLLREIRKQAGMSMSELAHIVGALPQSISRYEDGVTLPQAEMQAKIAAVFGVKPSTIFNGVPKLGRKKGGHNQNIGIIKLKAGQVRCAWCGNGTTKNIRMIGAGEDERRYCRVRCLGEYIWTKEEILD